MPKKEPLPPQQATLKEELDKEGNLIDYFLICGVKPSICLDNSLYEPFTQESITPMDDPSTPRQQTKPPTEPIIVDPKNYPKLTPEILTKCPSFDKQCINIDDGILNYCFPDGFGIVHSKTPISSKHITFILDNNFYSYDYPQKYVSCLIIYESLAKYKQLQDLSQQTEFNLNTSTASTMVSDTQSVTSNYTINSFTSTASCVNKIAGISIKNPNSPYYSYLNYYIPKCICLVSIYPFIEFHRKILAYLKTFSTRSNNIPIEKIILSLLIEVPKPPRGLYKIQYKLLNEQIDLSQNELNKIAKVNHNMKKVFLKFNDCKEILEIYKHVLFESKIIFFSQSSNTLCETILTFLSLIFPLKYPFQVATNVPKENYNLIESISPYIFGLNIPYTSTFFKDNEIDLSTVTILCVDIDNGHTYLHQFEDDEEIPKFPQKLYSFFKSELTEYLKVYPLKTNQKFDDEFNMFISNIFLDLIIGILSNYESYLNKDYYTSKENIQNTNINTMFKVNEFLKNCSSSERSFYDKLINESQMFVEFIYKRMIPKNINEKIEVLFVNEKIAELENKRSFFSKNEKYLLLTSQDYNVKSNYVIFTPKELSQNEYSYYTSENDDIACPLNQIKTYAQLIQLNKNKIQFSYLIFPVLNMELYFNETNIKNYILPPLNSWEIDQISSDIVSRSDLEGVGLRSIEMENYIYLTWLELWAFSFWYVDKKERNYQFETMMSVLNKVTHHEIEIFDFLFSALSAQNEEKMIQELYQKLIKTKLNPSTHIHSIINQIYDNKDVKTIMKNSTMRNRSNLMPNENKLKHEIPKYKRTYRCAYERNVLTEKIKFCISDTCFDCSETLNLIDISNDFLHMKKDIMWACCPNCKTFNLPKLKVKFGNECNSSKPNSWMMTSHTGTYDEVVLHSPFELKNNVKEGVHRNYGMNLDVKLFKMKFNALFWNAVWYFNLQKLDFSFILPYKKDIFPERTELNKIGNDFERKHSSKVLNNNMLSNNLNAMFGKIEEKTINEDDRNKLKEKIEKSLQKKNNEKKKNNNMLLQMETVLNIGFTNDNENKEIELNVKELEKSIVQEEDNEEKLLNLEEDEELQIKTIETIKYTDSEEVNINEENNINIQQKDSNDILIENKEECILNTNNIIEITQETKTEIIEEENDIKEINVNEENKETQNEIQQNETQEIIVKDTITKSKSVIINYYTMKSNESKNYTITKEYKSEVIQGTHNFIEEEIITEKETQIEEVTTYIEETTEIQQEEQIIETSQEDIDKQNEMNSNLNNKQNNIENN